MGRESHERNIYDFIQTGKEGLALQELEKAGDTLDPNWKNEDDSEMNILAIACLKGATEVVRKMLAMPSVDVNQLSEEMSAPLHYACLTRERKNDCARLLLLDKRVDVNIRDEDDQTPLWEAAHKGNVELVKLFIALRGEDLDFATLDKSERPWVVRTETITQSKGDAKLMSDQADISKIITSFFRHPFPVMVALRNELRITVKK